MDMISGIRSKAASGEPNAVASSADRPALADELMLRRFLDRADIENLLLSRRARDMV